MTSPYKKGLRISLILHGCLIFIFVASGLFKGCSCVRPKKMQEIPIEFTVAIPEEYVQPEAADAIEPEPEPIPEPIPETKKPETPKPEPKPKPKPEKVPIIKSDKIIHKKATVKPPVIIPLPPNTKTVKNPETKLTPKEIERLLDLGATVGEKTIVPAERERCLLAIKNALYAAWIKPSSEHKTGRFAVAEITLGPSGTILSRSIIESSGNKVLDDSVRAALAAVPRFTNLTDEFVKAHPTVSINFDLE